MISDCKFDGMYVGILATGTVMRPIIDRNIFSNLYRGVDFHTEDTQPGPMNGIISKNRFENIVQEGIFVGYNPDNIPSNHISKENNFVQVGNGLGLDDSVTSTTSGTTAVIVFQANGNESDADYFNRQSVANSTTDPDFYYNPLIVGRTSIRSGAAFTATLATESINQPVAKICLNDVGQLVTIKYQLSDFALSRKGTLSLNLSAEGYSVVTDTYNFTQGLYVITDNVTTATVGGLDTTQFAIDVSEFPTFDPTITTDIASSAYFMTGDNVYAGYAATIIAVAQTSATIYTFNTDSADPEFDFSTAGETWKLLRADSPSQDFNVSLPRNNYVELTCSNSSALTETLLEFQIDTLL
jgi:hypothetical protein